MKELKRELVSSSSDWKLLCWPAVSVSRSDARQADRCVGDLVHRLGELDLEDIREAARRGALDAEPGAADLVDGAEAGGR